MAFDMFSGSLHEEIGHHEEHIFALAAENESQYPELSGVWASFYADPRLSARQAGVLVHELIDLLAANGGTSNKALASTVIRLLAFFSAAYRNDLEVKCSSD